MRVIVDGWVMDMGERVNVPAIGLQSIGLQLGLSGQMCFRKHGPVDLDQAQ